jgi:hypothetical protein
MDGYSHIRRRVTSRGVFLDIGQRGALTAYGVCIRWAPSLECQPEGNGLAEVVQ